MTLYQLTARHADSSKDAYCALFTSGAEAAKMIRTQASAVEEYDGPVGRMHRQFFELGLRGLASGTITETSVSRGDWTFRVLPLQVVA